MSLIPAPIANFLSTYGPPLNKIFNTNAKIPLVCAIDPTGVALGGAGTVGNTEFLANFATAAGTSGQDAARAFDLSGPIPLMCMVNPDGTPYESYSVPYEEVSFNWTQEGTNDPIIARENINSPATGITPGYLGVGIFIFTFDPALFPFDRSKVEVVVTCPWAAIAPRTLYYQVQDTANLVIFSIDPTTTLGANGVGSVSGSQFSTINIKIYP